MSQITLHLSDTVASELARAGRETSRSPEAIAEEMIQRMIALRRFDRLRTEVQQAIGEAPPVGEDDILNGIS